MASVLAPDPPAPTLSVSKASRTNPDDLNVKMKNHCLLPQIYTTQEAGNLKTPKTDAHSSAVMNDFLPLDLLLCLKHQNLEAQGTPPGGTKFPQEKPIKTPREVGLVAAKPPANAWSHLNRRDKLKHLLEAPPCICGAGKDISFLYDISSSKEKTISTDKYLPSLTLIPDEYHVVKHPGVLALNIHDDDYVTWSDYHQNHLTLFPSLKPSSRYEAVALRHTLDAMLKRADIPSELRDEDLRGPTQMHKLLDLVQKEQTIYNIVFHELIRQVSMHCVERGELLADLRKRYANMLDRIPRQVKSLYNDMLAQKAVYRNLSQELSKFNAKIKYLTDELCLVKDHDQVVMEESRQAEKNLSAAIMNSEKNSELLNEYHGLYELQRNRLENQVHSLTQDLELWQEAAYNLSSRVAEEYLLYGVQKLQLSEKSWSKLARHFVIVLRSKDTRLLSDILDVIQEWQENLEKFLSKVHKMETNMKERLQSVSSGFSKWIEVYRNSISETGSVEVPSQTILSQLSDEIRFWLDTVSCEADQYAGVSLLAHLDELNHITLLMDKWTDVSLKLISRHQKLSSSKETPLQSAMMVADGIKKQSNRMVCITQALDAKLTSFKTRIRGDESGVSLGFVYLIPPLETWENRLGLVLSNSIQMTEFSVSDWLRLGKLFQEWKDKIDDMIECVGKVSPSRGVTAATLTPFSVIKSASTSSCKSPFDTSKTVPVSTSISTDVFITTTPYTTTDKIPGLSSYARKDGKMEAIEEKVGDVVKEKDEVEKLEAEEVEHGKANDDVSTMTLAELSAEMMTWYSDFSYAVDNQDTMMAEQAVQLHSNLVLWTVQLLLVITKTQVEEMAEVGSMKKMMIDHEELDSGTLRDNYLLLADTISFFTKRIHKCCKDIVQELVTEHTEAGYPLPDEEAHHLVHFGEEMEEWVQMAHLLLHDVRLRDGDDVLIDIHSRQSMASIGRLVTKGGEVSVESRRVGEDAAIVEDVAMVESKGVEVEMAAVVDQGVSIEEGGIIGVMEGEEVMAGEEEMKEVKEDKEDMTFPYQIRVIKDNHILQKSVQKAVEEKGSVPLTTSLELGLATEAGMPQGSVPSKEEAEAMLLALDHKNAALKEQEEQMRQMKALLLAEQQETKLAWSRVAALEKEVKEAKGAKHLKKLSRTGSRSSSRKQPVAPKSTSMQK